METRFKDKISSQKVILKKKTDEFNKLSTMRLLLGVAFIASLAAYFFYQPELLYILIAVVSFIAFIPIFRIHQKIGEEMNQAKVIIEINEKNIARIDGSWSEFSDIGKEFIDNSHNYSSDIDIVGKKSLFQFLNVTNTYHGRKQFASDLLTPNFTKEEIEARQVGIDELSKNIDFSENILYHLSGVNAEFNSERILKALSNDSKFSKSNTTKNLFKALPILTVLAIIIAFITDISTISLLAIELVIIQIFIWLIFAPKTSEFIAVIDNVPYKLKNYSLAFSDVENATFESPILNRIASHLSTSTLSASNGINDLNKITEMINYRKQGLFAIVLNALFLWDIQCCYRLETWKEKYGSSASNWFYNLGELESLISFSLLPIVCNNVTLPNFTEEKNSINATNLGHPLIKNSTRVCNDFSLNKNIYIITGSNMAGKTTFLRTIGINIILANAGSFVCANNFSCSPMKVISSMRIADDLNDGISTFYAEILRIKKIMTTCENEANTLFLIDEIFKGTNSNDRIYGAMAVIRNLNKLGASGIITTHDLELANLENEFNNIKNYSFSEKYANGEISFEYKMHQGKASTTNGKFLMEMIGII